MALSLRAECYPQLDRLGRVDVVVPGSRAFDLLSYLINLRLSPQGNRPVKAFALVVEVLGRGTDFDPATDSIVRVEIGRLRKLLDFYRTGPRRDDPVQFIIPKGQYALSIHRAQPPQPLEAADPIGWLRPLRALLAGGIALLALVAIGTGVFMSGHSAHSPAERPTVLILPLNDRIVRGSTGYLATGIMSFLNAELARFRSLRVAMPYPAAAPPATGTFLLD